MAVLSKYIQSDVYFRAAMRVYEEQPEFGAGEMQMKFVSYDVGIWQ